MLAQDAEGNNYYALEEVVLTEDGQHVVLFSEDLPLDADDLFSGAAMRRPRHEG